LPVDVIRHGIDEGLFSMLQGYRDKLDRDLGRA